MSWLLKVLGKPSAEEKAEVDSAFEQGRQCASSMAADLDQLMALRFGHVKDAYLGILRQSICDAMLREDHSPMIVARMDYSLFQEKVQASKVKMRKEIMIHMKGWIEAFDKLGSPEVIGRAVDARLDEFELDLTAKGMTALTERIAELKAADDAWRAAHPDKALREPLDQADAR